LTRNSSGGLPGRLLALQQQQGLYQPDAGFDRSPSVPQLPVLQPMPWPNGSDNGSALSVSQNTGQDLQSRYAALRPILGDHNAMRATVNPEAGQALIAQALASQQQSGNPGNAVLTGYDGPLY
jgi:hypothetical protein